MAAVRDKHLYLHYVIFVVTSKANLILTMHVNVFVSSLLSADWYVFIGPLVKGSNRYQDVRAGFSHDTSGIKKPRFFPIMVQALYVLGEQIVMMADVVRTK